MSFKYNISRLDMEYQATYSPIFDYTINYVLNQAKLSQELTLYLSPMPNTFEQKEYGILVYY
jgi:hypothetical protein